MLRDAYIGDDKVARIYTGDKIVHPSPVRDGLVLWYDFMGRKNSDAQRAVAEDLSGNGNDGQLQNFAYTAGSGYEDEREIEGRNLLKGNYRVLPNNQTRVSHLLESFEGHYRIKAILNQSGEYGGISTYLNLNPSLGIPAGNTTTSVLVKPENDCRIGIVNDKTSYKDCKAGEWTKIIARHTVAITNVVWGLISTTTPVDSWIEFKDFKLELGTAATPWRPAMEDPEYEAWAREQGFRRALKFDGVDDNVQLLPFSDDSIIKYDKQYSLECVLDFNGEDVAVFGHQPSSDETRTGAYVYKKRLRFGNYNRDIGWRSTIITDDLQIGKKYHIVFRKEIGVENLNFSIYVDGLLSSIIHGGFYLSHAGFHIGRIAITGEGGAENRRPYLLDGNLTAFKLYNRALTPEEIAHNYAMEKERWNL